MHPLSDRKRNLILLRLKFVMSTIEITRGVSNYPPYALVLCRP